MILALIILVVLLVIGLIVVYFVRTYDAISQLKAYNEQQINHQQSKNKALKESLGISISEKETKILDKINETKKNVEDSIGKNENNIKHNEVSIEGIKTDLISKLEILRNNTTQEFSEFEENQLKNMQKQIDGIDGSINEDLLQIMRDLENELGGEIDILKEKVDEVETSVSDNALNWSELKQETDKDILPLQNQMSELKKQIDTNSIKVAEYVVNYDKATRHLKLRSNDVNDSSTFDMENAIVDNMTVEDDGKLSFATLDSSYEFSTGKDKNMEIKLPEDKSELRLRILQNVTPSHTFTGDGIAKHTKGIVTPYVQIGRYRLIEKDNKMQLVDQQGEYDNITL
jgi:uncharacterized protein YneF (UPF0154 family)